MDQFNKLRKTTYRTPSARPEELEQKAKDKESRMALAPLLEQLSGAKFIADDGEGLITKQPVSKLDNEPYQLLTSLGKKSFVAVSSSCPVMPATRKMNEDHLRVVVHDEAAFREYANGQLANAGSVNSVRLDGKIAKETSKNKKLP